MSSLPKSSPIGRSLPTRATQLTPKSVFLHRRDLLRGALAAAVSATAACGRSALAATDPAVPHPGIFPAARNDDIALPDTVSASLTPRETAATHNNFYEFLPGRAGEVWKHAHRFEASPWTLEVTGAVRKPRVLSLEDLFDIPHEERRYHFRCVERWAMNVPWTGFPLHVLLEGAQPLPTAQAVRFVSATQPDAMPGLAEAPHYPWPYREALRLDEALHPLTLLATGVYGAPLPKGHGAPVRLVVPWKYGYKSAKSIHRIEVMEDVPTTFWSEVSPHEYGFLSNVNPNIPHPRWSQELSFVLRDAEIWPTHEDTFPTPLFNGYEAEVAQLYPDEPRTPQPPLAPGQTAR